MECLPIAGSIAGAHGSDLMLIDLVKQAFDMAGRLTDVTAGRRAFPQDGWLTL
ncbi:hypothetical protein QBC35DRAFT_453514 [Podospora australis]|uniref:Uncharacterized protein n=1 Tax=Podospora australis TaxID=1536484 RepID=A0AAN7AF22_9PEZI|nr:hypothetical protein QBC35DRAFT_453514 [Podospora australis]